MILVTGGAGFIGSHSTLVLQQAGYEVLVLDNWVNSSPEALARVAALSGKEVPVVEGDVRDRALLKRLFAEHKIEAVMHFAALKAVGESVHKPLEYFDNNVSGTLVLLEAMRDAGVETLVFSSSATVYGVQKEAQCVETMALGNPASPYGQSKKMIEEILCAYAKAHPKAHIALLRYFNPIGAHESGTLGEVPRGTPNNLLPYITQVAVGRQPQLSIYGGDYDTKDGSCERDYIHVMDLAEGHLAALKALPQFPGANAWNLGSGRPYSVLEIVHAFEEASGQTIPYAIVPRRPGDLPTTYANPEKAARDLGWRARRDLAAMMRDSWHFQQQNPQGY